MGMPKGWNECNRLVNDYYTYPIYLPNKAIAVKLDQAQMHLKKMYEVLLDNCTTCTHDEKDPNYRPLGDTYGWCSICSTKVHYKENEIANIIKEFEEWK